MEACNLEDDDNIIKLKELTKTLDFAEMINHPLGVNIEEFDLEQGTSFMVGLFHRPVMAVARVFSSAGTIFPAHKHDEWELVVVYQGEIHLEVEGKKIVLKEKQFHYLNPGQSHSAFYPVDSWVLCITKPASDDFPKGG